MGVRQECVKNAYKVHSWPGCVKGLNRLLRSLCLFCCFSRCICLQDKFIGREIETLTLSANHPSVIDIFGVLSTPGRTFVIMPLVESDLAQRIQVAVMCFVRTRLKMFVREWGVAFGSNFIHTFTLSANPPSCCLVSDGINLRSFPTYK